METAKLFMNGNSQAVRLPKEFRFEGNEVYIKREGNAVILTPKEFSWEDWWNSWTKVSDDFMIEREQPTEQQEREEIFP